MVSVDSFVRSPLFIYFKVIKDNYIYLLREAQSYFVAKKPIFFPLTTDNRQLTSRSDKPYMKGLEL